MIRNPGRLEQPLANLARLRGALSESNLPLLVEVFDFRWRGCRNPFVGRLNCGTWF